MKQGRKSRKALLIQASVACLSLAVWSGSAGAQTTGGTGGTGGTTTGGGGGTSAAPTQAAGGTTVFGAAGMGAAGTATTTGTSTIQKSDFMSPYYASPMASGWGGNVTLKSQAGLSFNAEGTSASYLVTGKGAFGVPITSVTTSTKTATAGAAKGAAKGATNTAKAVTSLTTTAASSTVKRNVGKYTTQLAPEIALPPMAPPQLQTQMQTNLGSVLTQAPTFQAKGLNVKVDPDQVVVLTGVVETESQRKLAENMLRLEPGVRTIRNDIIVVGGKK